MVIDQPLVVYPKAKDKPASHTGKKMDDVYERWLRRKQDSKAVVGKKISLSDYLRTK